MNSTYQSFEVDTNTSFEEIDQVYTLQSNHKLAASITSIDYRRNKLKTLQSLFYDHRDELCKAMYADFCKPEPEVDLTEILIVMNELKHTIRHISSWLAKHRVNTPWFLFGASSYIKYEAKGQCLIISPWNFPIHLTILPIMHSFAAGNVSIVKPSEFTPYTNAVVQKIINAVFTAAEVSFVEGNAEVAEYLTSLRFDHIFFTGSPIIGKKVMQAAAKHLTSVTLELGGKSPLIIDKHCNMHNAIKFAAVTKFINAGQYCIAPDYFLVHKSQVDHFIEKFKMEFENAFGHSIADFEAKHFCHIVNGKQAQKMRELIQDAKAKGAKPVLEYGDNEKELIGPVLFTQVTDKMRIVQEEVFGPVAYIQPFEAIDEAIAYIRQKEKPLTLYLFSDNKDHINKIVNGTASGNVCINAVALNYYNPDLPFGGVNQSGTGKGHGFYSFKEMSNAKSVLKQWLRWPAIFLFFPPFDKSKKKLFNIFLNFFR